MEKACAKCNSENIVKAGFARSKQRYKCKQCGFHFTTAIEIAYPVETKRRAIQLYLEGLGFRAIGRVLGMSNTTVLNWVRDLGEKLEALKSEQPAHVGIMELDELCTFVGQKNERFGSGLLLSIKPDNSSPLKWGLVQSPSENASGKR